MQKTVASEEDGGCALTLCAAGCETPSENQASRGLRGREASFVLAFMLVTEPDLKVSRIFDV